MQRDDMAEPTARQRGSYRTTDHELDALMDIADTKAIQTTANISYSAPITSSSKEETSTKPVTKPNRENFKCGICYTALNRKRTVFLGCGHSLHRTCLLNWCESNITVIGENGKTIPATYCAICNTAFSDGVFDEKNRMLPEIIGFGPNGQPSQLLLYVSFETPEVFKRCVGDTLVVTAEYLLLASKDLQEAHQLGQSDEYIQDIIDEQNKLITRYQMILQMQEEHAAIQTRIKASVQTSVCLIDSAPNVQDTKGAIEAVNTEEAGAINENEPTCGICFEELSRKPSVHLAACNHSFHRTCIHQWFESKQSFRKLTCCICRSLASEIDGVIDKDGETIPITFPFEQRDETNYRWTLDCFHDYWCRIVKQHERLAHQKRLALRDGKSAEYIADIDEERAKLGKRYIALNRHRLVVAERKKIEQLNEQSTSVSDSTETDAVAVGDSASSSVVLNTPPDAASADQNSNEADASLEPTPETTEMVTEAASGDGSLEVTSQDPAVGEDAAHSGTTPGEQSPEVAREAVRRRADDGDDVALQQKRRRT